MNVYDFDGTIYDGDSTIDFYKFLVNRKKALIFKMPNQIIHIIKYIFKLISKEELKECFYNIFQSFDNIDECVNQFWDSHVYKIKEWYLEQQKSSDVIISASPFLLLEPVCKKLGVKYLIASNVNKKTGKFIGVNCYGEEKVIRFKEKFNNLLL